MAKLAFKKNSTEIIISLLFTITMILGINAETGDSLFSYLKNPGTLILSLILFCILVPVNFGIVKILKYAINVAFNKDISVTVFRSHGFKKTWFFIFVAWLPIAIFRYPAGVEWDAYHQIDQFLNGEITSQYWAPASSACMGVFVWISRKLFNSSNIGLFSFVIFQMGFMSYVFTRTVRIAKRLVGYKCLTAIMALFYALCPAVSITCTSVVKDILYGGLALLFVINIFEYSFLNEKKTAKLIITGILMSVIRSYGVYVIFFSLLVALIRDLVKKDKKYRAFILACVICVSFYYLYSSIILPSVGIAKSQSSAFLFLPMMQTARYVKYCPGDVTVREKELINAVFDYEKLAEVYDPLMADPVWALVHGSNRDYINYLFGAWLPEFFKHPSVYFSATFINLHGFFYPNSALDSYNGLSSWDIALYFNMGDPWNNLPEYYSIPNSIMPAREYLLKILWQITGNPFYRLLNSAAIHVWILLYLLLSNLKAKSRKAAFVCLPSFVNFLACMVSTTYYHNGARYALPIVYCTMFCLFITKYEKNSLPKPTEV